MTIAPLILSLTLADPAIVISVIGDVQIGIDDSKVALNRFDEVPEGATIHTEADSFATLRLASGSELRLGPETRMTLRQHEQGKPAGSRVTRVKLAIGKVWAHAMQLFGNDARFDIETENAVAGVRGTSFWVSSTGVQDKFVVDSGALRLSREGVELDLDGAGAFTRTSDTGFEPPGRMSRGELFGLRRAVGGPGGIVLHRLPPSQPAQPPKSSRGKLRKTLVGPDRLVDSPLRVVRPGDQVRGTADITVTVRPPEGS